MKSAVLESSFMDRAIVIFKSENKGINVDIDIPLDITASELVIALNSAYSLGIDTGNIRDCYLKSENPIALIKGNRFLKEYGIRNGSVIYRK